MEALSLTNKALTINVLRSMIRKDGRLRQEGNETRADFIEALHNLRKHDQEGK